MNQLPTYRWLKLNITLVDDPAFMVLTDAAAGTYVKLYLFAARADMGGLIGVDGRAYTIRDLSWALHVPAEQMRSTLDELVEAELIEEGNEGFQVVRFMDEQGPADEKERAKWKERQQKSRARKKEKELEEGKKRQDPDLDTDKIQIRESRDIETMSRDMKNSAAAAVCSDCGFSLDFYSKNELYGKVYTSLEGKYPNAKPEWTDEAVGEELTVYELGGCACDLELIEAGAEEALLLYIKYGKFPLLAIPDETGRAESYVF